MNVEEDAEKKFQVVLKSKKETIKLNAPSAEGTRAMHTSVY